MIREGLWSVSIPMPGSFLSYTLCFVQLDDSGQVHLIDPGSAGVGAIEIIEAFLATHERTLDDIVTIVVTHSHPDHLGCAEELRERSGATLVMTEREQDEVTGTSVARIIEQLRRQVEDWGMPDEIKERLLAVMARNEYGEHPNVKADVLVGDGDEIAGTGWRVLTTPGHTAGHMCLVDTERELLFTGDHVLPTVNPGIGLSGSRDDENAVTDMLHSLEKLAPYDEYEVCPGHGYRFAGLGERRAAQAEHIWKRVREVEAILQAEPEASVWNIASQLTWSAGWETLQQGTLLASGLAQTGMYRDAVRSGITQYAPAPADEA